MEQVIPLLCLLSPEDGIKDDLTDASDHHGIQRQDKHDINTVNQLFFMQNPNAKGRKFSQQIKEKYNNRKDNRHSCKFKFSILFNPFTPIL